MRKLFSTLSFVVLMVLLSTANLLADPPSTQARYIGFSNVQSQTMTISWINGNGGNRIVVMRAGSAVDLTTIGNGLDVVTTDIEANSAFGSGDAVGTGTYVVYNGSGSGRTVSVSNLIPGTTYYVKVLEYQYDGSTVDIHIGNGTNNPRSITTPLSPPSILNNTTIYSATSASISWQGVGAEGYIIKVEKDDDGDENLTGFSGTTYSEYDDLDVGDLEGLELEYLTKALDHRWQVKSYVGSRESEYSTLMTGDFTPGSSPAFTTSNDVTPPTFDIQYYSDITLQTSLGINPYLKVGTYYVKITANEELDDNPTISINLTDNTNDETDQPTVSVGENIFRYERIILDDASNGELETWTITGTDVAGNPATNVSPSSNTGAAYIDTDAPGVTTLTVDSDNQNQDYAKSGDEIWLAFTANENVVSTYGSSTVSLLNSNFKFEGTSFTDRTVVAANTQYTATFTLTGNETEGAAQFAINVYDLAGNAATFTQANISGGGNVTLDFTSPTATTLTVISNNGTNTAYAKNGDVVTLALVTSENVYKSDQTTALDVTSFQMDGANADGVTVNSNSSSSVTMNVDGSSTEGVLNYDITVYDIAGNMVVFNENNSTNSSSVTIDRTAPTVQTERNPVTDGSFTGTTDNAVSWDIWFSETVTGFTAADIDLLKSGTAASSATVAMAGPVSGTYTQEFTGITGDGDLTLQIINTGFTDLAGNQMLANYESSSFTIDNTLPTLTNLVPSSATISEANVGTNTFYLTLTFNEAMNQGVAPTIAFTPDDATCLSAPSGSWTSSTVYEKYYTVTDNEQSLAGIDVRLTLAEDLAGNVIAQTDVSNTFSVDLAKPTVVSVTPSTATITTDNVGVDAFRIDVVFSEAMDQANGNKPTLSFPVEDPTSAISATSGSWTTSTTFSQYYTVTDNNLNIANIDVRVAGGKDIALNTMSLHNQSDVFNIDLLEPTVTGITYHPDNNPGNGNEINVNTATFYADITFSEAMNQSVNPSTSFTNPDLVTSGVLTYFPGSSSWQSSTVFRAFYNVSDGAVSDASIDVAVSGAEDLKGNTQTVYSAVGAIQVDQVEPTVLSVTPNWSGVINRSRIGQTFRLSITFSENMNQSTAPVVTFPTENPSNFLTVSGTSGWLTSTVYLAEYTVVDFAQELADIDVTVASAVDSAGNTQTSSTTTNNFDADLIAPTVTITRNSITSGSNYITSDNTVSFDIDFSEEVTAFTNADIIMSVTGTATGTKSALTIDNASLGEYTQTFTAVSGDGYLSIMIDNAAFEDLAGNTMVSDAWSGTFTIDNTAPTVTVTRNAVTLGSFTGTTDNTISFDIDFSEELLNFGDADLSLLTSGTAAGTEDAIVTDNLSAGEYTQTISTVTGDGNLSLLISNAGFTDLAGNAMAVNYESASFTIDNTPPTVVITRNPVTLGTFTGTTDNSVSYDLDFSEQLSNFTEADITLVTTGNVSATKDAVTVDNLGAGEYTQNFSAITGDGNLSIVIVNSDFTDLAGNPMVANATSATFTIDNTLPTVLSINRQNPTWEKTNSTSVTWRVTFSEDIDHTTLSNADFALIGDNVGETIAISATVTPLTVYDITVSGIDVTGSTDPREIFGLNFTGTVDDLSGNASTAQFTTSQSYTIDQIAPEFTLGGYYTNVGLTNQVAPISGTTYLKEGTYYLKIMSSEALSAAPTVFLDGNANGNLGENSDLNGVAATSSASWTYYSTVVVPANGTLAYTGTTSSSITISGTEDYTNGDVSTANVTTQQDVTGEAVYDNTVPTQAATTHTANGGTVVATYYNSTNNGVEVYVPIANDATLEGGRFYLQYDVNGANSWNYVPAPASATHTITNGNLNNSVTVTFTDGQLTNLVNDGSYINFRALTYDRAGNSVIGTASTTFTRDETAPTEPVVLLNGGAYINQFNYTNVSLDITGEVGSTYNYSISTSGAGGPVTNTGTIPGGGTANLTGINLSALGDGTITASVTLTDPAGNVSTAGTDTEVKDIVGPQITGITSTTLDGTYIINQTVAFDVTYGETVYVTGTPQLPMDLDQSQAQRYANYVSGSPNTTLAFTYTIVEDDQAADLAWTFPGNMSISSATLTDLYGNSASVTLPNNATFLTDNAIVVDARKPRFTIKYTTDPGGNNSTLTNYTFSTGTSQNNAYLHIEADEPISGNLTLNIAAQGTQNDKDTTLTVVPGFDDYFRYRRHIYADDGTDGTVREVITVSGSDVAGNTVVATVGNGYIESDVNRQAYIDCTSPTFTLQYYSDLNMTSSLGNNPGLKAGTYYIKIIPSEGLSETPTVKILAEGTANDVDPAVTSTYIGPLVYRFPRTVSTDASAIGAVLEDIYITATDNNGNVSTLVNPANATAEAYTDTKAPIINAGTFTAPSTTATTYWNQGAKTITWNTGNILEESVYQFATNPANFEYSINNGVDWTSISSATLNSGNLVWNVPDVDVTQAKVKFRLTDHAGNISDWFESAVFTIDNTPPTVSSVTYTPNNSPLGGYEINATTTGFNIAVEFNEDMLQSSTPTIAFANPNLAPDVLTFSSGSWLSARVYRAIYTVADANFTALSVEVDVTGATDLATNTQVPYSAPTIQIDQVNPTITPISTASDNVNTNARAKAGDDVTVTMVSNETLNGITVNALTSNGVTVNAFPGSTSNNSNTWTVLFTVNSLDDDGLVGFNITNTDLAGNNTIVSAVTDGSEVTVDNTPPVVTNVFSTPSPLLHSDAGINTFSIDITFDEKMDAGVVPTISLPATLSTTLLKDNDVSGWIDNGDYFTYSAVYDVVDNDVELSSVSVTITSAQDSVTNVMATHIESNEFVVDMKQPSVVSITPSSATINEAVVGTATFSLTVVFDENMDQTVAPVLSFPVESPTSLAFNGTSGWSNATTYVARYNVGDNNLELSDIDVDVASAKDVLGNTMVPTSAFDDVFDIDLLAPTVTLATLNTSVVNESYVGNAAFTITLDYSENMSQSFAPTVSFVGGTPSALALDGTSGWSDANTYVARYDVTDNELELANIDFTVTGGKDIAENTQNLFDYGSTFLIDLKKPTVTIGRQAVTCGTFAGTTDNSVTYTIQFSEAINNGTFLAGDDIQNWFEASSTDQLLSNTGNNINYYYAINGITGNGPLSISVKNNGVSAITDVAGNSLEATVNSDMIQIDNTPATISGSGAIATAINAGYYFDITMNDGVYANCNMTDGLTTGDFAVTFNTNAGSGGTATGITLVAVKQNNNTNATTATALAGGETTVRVFYNVVGTAAGVETFEIKPFDANSIFDDAGNGMLADQTTGLQTLIDETAPVISNILEDGTYEKQGNNVEIKFEMIEAGGIEDNDPIVAVYKGATPLGTAVYSSRTGAGISGNSYTYTYNYTTPADDYPDVSISVNATDDAGNIANPAILNNAFHIDNTAPVIQNITEDGTYEKSGSVVNIQFEVVEVVGQTANPTVVIRNFEDNLTIGNGVFGSKNGTGTELDPYVYEYTFTVGAGNYNNVRIEIDATDDAANAATQGYSPSATFTIDNTAPVISNILDNGTIHKSGAVVQITFDVVETVALNTNPTVTIRDNGDAETIGTAVFAERTGSGNPYSYTYNFTVGAGNYNDVRIEVDATDDAGNAATQGLVTDAFTIDNTAPVISNISDNGAEFKKQNDIVTITFDIVEAVALTTIPNSNPLVELWTNGGNGWLATATYSNRSGSGSPYSYTYTLTVPGGDHIGARIKVNANDDAGNIATEAGLLPAFTIDNTAPGLDALTITSNNAVNTHYAKNGDLVTLSINANENLNTLTVATIEGNNVLGSLAGANDTRTVTWTAANSLNKYSEFDITLQDLAGNTASYDETDLTGVNLKFDNLAPSVSSLLNVSSNVINNMYAKDGHIITIDLTANEDLNTLTVATAEGNNILPNLTNNADALATTWELTWTVAGALNKSFAFAATMQDSAGNTTNITQGNLTAGGAITLDNTAPGIQNLSASSNNGISPIFAKDGHVITIEIEADEDLHTITAATAEGNNVLGSLTNNGDLDASTWDYDWEVTGNLNKTFEFGFTMQDLAGNTTVLTQTAITGTNVTIDNTPPNVTTLTISSNNGINNAYAKDGHVVTIELDANENLNALTAATVEGSNGSITNNGDEDASTWDVAWTVAGGLNKSTAFSITMQDMAGNTAIKTQAHLSGSNVTLDNTLPVISITAPTAGTRVNLNPFDFSVTEANLNSTQSTADGTNYSGFASGNLANQLGGWANVNDNTPFTATIRHTDLAGNIGTSTVNLTKDVSIPVAQSISTSVSNGCYNNGDIIPITLTFNENVYVTNTPRLVLNTTPTAYATYASGSGSQNIVFNYTVGTEEVADLDVTTISLNGGTLKDQALNAVIDATDITLGINGFNDNHAIVIDNTAPTVSSRTPADNSLNVEINQTLTIQFSEEISMVNGKTITIVKTSPFNTFATYTLGTSSEVTKINSTTIEINPSSNFECGSPYAVFIDSDAVVDCAANEFAGYASTLDWNFTTTPAPTVKTITGPNAPYCFGDNLVVVVPTSQLGYTYELYRDGNVFTGVSEVGTGNNLNLTLNSAPVGTYTVLGVNSQCETLMNGSVSVYTPPTAVLLSSDVDDIICAGDEVTFTASGATTYQFFKNGTSVQGPNATDTYVTTTLANNDNVWVVVSNGDCSDASDTFTMTVNPLPTPTLSSSDGDNVICDGTLVTFTAGGGTSYNFFKNGNSVQNGAGNTYATTGLANNDNVYVVVTNANGCIAQSSPIQTTVHDLPTPSLISSDGDNSICYGDEVTFTASGGTNYHFYLNNGSVQNGAGTTYVTSGLQNNDKVHVIITNANNCSISSSTISTEVLNVPNATILADDNTICAGTNVTFTAGPGGMATYTFKVNGNTVQSSASYTYQTTSLTNGQQVTVVSTNSNGCFGTSSAITMTVYDYPNASLSSSAVANTICSGNSVTFTASPAGQTGYEFFLNNVSAQSGSGNTFVTNTLTHAAEVYVVVSNNGCTDQSDVIVTTVNTTPGQAGAITGSTTVNKGDNAVAYSISTVATATDYEWEYTGTGITMHNETTNSITIDFGGSATGGSLRVRAHNDCGYGAWSNAITITVEDALEGPSIIGDPSNLSACQGSSATFSVTGITGNPRPDRRWQESIDNNIWADVSLEFDFSVSPDTLQLYISNVNGKNGYYYRLRAVNNQDPFVDISAPALLTVTAPVTPSVSISTANTTICSGANVTFTATPTNGGTPSYQWKLNGGNVGQNQNTYSTSGLVNSDVVTCVMTTSLSCVTTSTATSNQLTMTVNTPPTYSAHPQNVTISSGANTSFSATVNGTTPTYQWQVSVDGGTNWSNVTNGGVYSDATTATLQLAGTPSSYDGYKYKLLSDNNCSTDPGVISNVATLTVNPGPEKLVITGIPSPATSNSQFTITVTARDNGGTARSVGANTPIHISAATGSNFSHVEVVAGQDTIMDSGTSQVSFLVKLHSTNDDKNGATNVTLIADNNGGHELNTEATAAFTLMSMTPVVQADSISWTGVGRNSINFNWTHGSGLGTLVLAKAASSISDTPVNGNNGGLNYTASDVFSSGDVIGTSRIVYNSTNTSIAITGLSADTRYCFRLFAYSGSVPATRSYNTVVLPTNLNIQRNTMTMEKDIVIDDPVLLNKEFNYIVNTEVSPNPAKNYIDLNLELNYQAPITITIHSLAGSELLRPVQGVMYDAGSHKINIPFEHLNLAAGTYLIVIGAGPEVVMDRFVIIK